MGSSEGVRLCFVSAERSETLPPLRKLERYLTGEVARNDLVFSVLLETLKLRRTLVWNETKAVVINGFETLYWVLSSWITIEHG